MSSKVHHYSSSSSHSNESKLEKEKSRLIQEKCQGMLNDMLRDEDNKYCVDCDAKGPRWASWNLGIFLCIRCAGIHRNLGVHISRVKSVNLDTWTPEQVMTMAQFGNSRARAIYEANLPDSTRRPQTDIALESFIRAKYEHKKYIAKEYIPTPVPKPNWDQEIEEMLKKKKKAGTVNQDIVLPLKQLGSQRAAASAAANRSKQDQQSRTKTNTTAADIINTNNNNTEAKAKAEEKSTAQSLSDDLLGLSLDSNNGPTTNSNSSGQPSSDPFASPIKEPNTSTTTNSTTSASDDLFSLESGGTGSGIDLLSTNKLMSKESIMSLYGKSNGTGGMPSMAQPQQQQTQPQLGGGLSALNPFLISGPPTTAGVGFPQQQGFGASAGGSGFGLQQPQQGLASQQQAFLFNNNPMTTGAGLVSSPQQQLFQFQQTNVGLGFGQQQQQPVPNQFAYPGSGSAAGGFGLGLGGGVGVAAGGHQQNQFSNMIRSPQIPNANAFLFAQPTSATSTPNFLN